MRGDGFDAGEDGTGRGTPLGPVGVTINGTDPTVQKVASYSELAQCLRARTPGNIDNSSTTVVQHPVTVGTLSCNTGPNGHDAGNFACNQAVDAGHVLPVCFDTTQITSAANYSNPKAGDPCHPCHPLAAGANPPAIAFSAKDYGADASTELAPTLRAMGHTDSHANGGGQMAVLAFHSNAQADQLPGLDSDTSLPSALTCSQNAAVCVSLRGREDGGTAELGDEVGNCLRASSGGGAKPPVLTQMQVRRLTPRECERLMGFPDDHTLLPGLKKPVDGPRYKALGNSMAVPVMRWIGQQIDLALLFQE